MRVLVAEDDLTSRMILSAILRKWGYEVEEAVDGQEALKLLQQQNPPRIALLDWSMPGLSGVDVCSKLREDSVNDSIYIIILTAKSEKKNVVDGLNAGANDYIKKPYDNDELKARINVGRRMIEIQTELEKAKNALIHEAMHDGLTGLYNRKAILELLKKEFSHAKRFGGMVRVAMCDLDHFKRINDKYGHQTGDEILIGFADLIKNNLREYDLAGRYGGEEFIIIVPAFENGKEKMDFKRICRLVSETKIDTRSGPVSVTVSIGVSESDGNRSIDEILTEADDALYRAKGLGRNCVCFAE